MKKMALAAALFALVLGAPVAHASPSIWVQCDGQARPEGDATRAARIGAIVFIPIVGLLAAGEQPAPPARGQVGVDACTQALAEPVLANFWQRHLNILRARAIHYVEIENYDAALADVTAMHGVGEGEAASPLLDRSIGVSGLILEAALRAREGDFERARALAVQAADARPYSRPLQSMALRFFAGSATFSPEEQRLYLRQTQYDPTRALSWPSRLDQTDDVQAAADAWEAALTAGDHMGSHELDAALGWDPSQGPDGYTLLRAALAMARANRASRAIELAERAEARLGPELVDPAQPAENASRDAGSDKSADLQTRVDDVLARTAAPYRPLLRAWVFALRGDDPAALALVQTNIERLPRMMATVDLLRRFNQNSAFHAQMPDFLVQSVLTTARPDQAARFREVRIDDVIRTLPEFERIDGPSRYRQGHGSSTGYSNNETREGLTQISYTGGTFYSTGEMLLLRAAQLAQERGFDSFAVVDAHQNVITVSVMNAGAPSPGYANRGNRLISARDVIADLGPIYIDLAAAMDAANPRDRGRTHY